MKKEYKKPMIMFEVFALSQSIAVNCGISTIDGSEFGRPTLQEIGDCGWEDSLGEIVWLEDSEVCVDLPVDEDTQVGGLCYGNPNGGVSIFGSA